MANIVYIATSIDGFIADNEGGINWLMEVPPPENEGVSFSDFMDRIDALVMGRKTFETVVGFGGDWPYSKKVFVLSNSLKVIPDDLKGKVEIISGELHEVVEDLNSKGYRELYIDGGKTVQSFLKAGLIDEMIITSISKLLGGGIPLFSDLNESLKFKVKNSERLSEYMSQTHYIKA